MCEHVYGHAREFVPPDGCRDAREFGLDEGQNPEHPIEHSIEHSLEQSIEQSKVKGHTLTGQCLGWDGRGMKGGRPLPEEDIEERLRCLAQIADLVRRHDPVTPAHLFSCHTILVFAACQLAQLFVAIGVMACGHRPCVCLNTCLGR